MSSDMQVGDIVWHDLTVKDADSVSNFYEQVVGWEKAAVSMGDYDDYNMNKPTGECAAGVCHARGSNAKIPAQWMMYVKVADAEVSAQQCIALGGEIIDGPRSMGGDTYYFIKDPAGAALAIFS